MSRNLSFRFANSKNVLVQSSFVPISYPELIIIRRDDTETTKKYLTDNGASILSWEVVPAKEEEKSYKRFKYLFNTPNIDSLLKAK